jgi:hypothetical protein
VPGDVADELAEVRWPREPGDVKHGVPATVFAAPRPKTPLLVASGAPIDASILSLGEASVSK